MRYRYSDIILRNGVGSHGSRTSKGIKIWCKKNKMTTGKNNRIREPLWMMKWLLRDGRGVADVTSNLGALVGWACVRYKWEISQKHRKCKTALTERKRGTDFSGKNIGRVYNTESCFTRLQYNYYLFNCYQLLSCAQHTPFPTELLLFFYDAKVQTQCVRETRIKYRKSYGTNCFTWRNTGLSWLSKHFPL